MTATQPQFTWLAVMDFLSGVPNATNKEIAGHFRVSLQDASSMTRLMRSAGVIDGNKLPQTMGAAIRYFVNKEKTA